MWLKVSVVSIYSSQRSRHPIQIVSISDVVLIFQGGNDAIVVVR